MKKNISKTTTKDKNLKVKETIQSEIAPKIKTSQKKETRVNTPKKTTTKKETTKLVSSKKSSINTTNSKNKKIEKKTQEDKKQKNIIKETDVNEKSKTIETTTNVEDYDLNHVELDFENEVYDDADIASALELGFIAQALEAHKQKVAKETHPDFDGETCLDCGDDIPKERLNMGKIRCVYCQAALERKNKLLGK